ncbi:MAG: protein kinase [Chloroflexi bacterium]|nr:protein kinase [Chloroflexota bacterium]
MLRTTLTLLVVAAGALYAVPFNAFASSHLVHLTTGTAVIDGEPASVELRASNFTSPGLGSWTIDLSYDTNSLDIVTCSAELGGVCNPAYGFGVARVTGASGTTLTGDITLATLAFRCLTEGLIAVDVRIVLLADGTLEEPQSIDAEARNGIIDCRVTRPTPTNTPVPPDDPTPTPLPLPDLLITDADAALRFRSLACPPLPTACVPGATPGPNDLVVAIMVDVSNNGEPTDSPMLVRVSSQSIDWEVTASVPALGPSETRTITMELQVPLEARGISHDFLISVALIEDIEEQDEENNEFILRNVEIPQIEVTEDGDGLPVMWLIAGALLAATAIAAVVFVALRMMTSRRNGGHEGERQESIMPTQGQGGGGAVTETRIAAASQAQTFASGRYIVRRLLGQGAQKSVYLVDDTVLGRQCALSMLNAALLDPGDVDRMRREAETMAQFGSQSNIVTVYDFGEEDGAPYIVCEYVPGGELRAELTLAAGPLPLERALAVAMDICRALSFAHGRNIVHRDVKPENVWLTEERNAKLGDFGIALAIGRTRLTAAGGITGTATYMSPEQISGGDVDARSDLYSFGALLYELVTGRPPFVGDDPNAIMYQHVNTKPESPVEHNKAVPPGLERLIIRLLAKPKEERPGSADEVLAELERIG